ncbi:hypothetical protein ACWCXH_15985 [Kitasatospora sp. NPDC001660]
MEREAGPIEEDAAALEHPPANWPTVELDPVRRVRVMAAAAGDAPMFAERHCAASFDEVWSVASDLERELPRMVTALRSFEVGPAADGGPRLTGLATSSVGHRERFDIVLSPGWCLMQSRVLLGGTAAAPEAGGTRSALRASLRLPGPAPAQRLLGRLVRSPA